VLRFKFTVPQGYTIDNGANAVSISGSGGQAQFGTGRFSGGLDTYVGDVFRGLAGENNQIRLPECSRPRSTAMPAALRLTRAQTNGGQVDVSVIAYRWAADTAYHFVTIVPAGGGIGPFREMIDSLSPMSASESRGGAPGGWSAWSPSGGATRRERSRREWVIQTTKLERFLVLKRA
jgi:predicted Zn-dependent protease